MTGLPDTGHPDDTLDAYVGADGGWYPRLRLSKDDLSPTVVKPFLGTEENALNIRIRQLCCLGCRLNFCHSTAYHDRAVQEDSDG